MGNDSSKQTIENQQMIMQLQQQILNQGHIPQKTYNNINRLQNVTNRVISAAELQQRSIHPTMNFMNDSSSSMNCEFYRHSSVIRMLIMVFVL